MFLTAVTTEHLERIRATELVVLDLETTGLTPFGQPIRIGKATRVAGMTLNQYTQRVQEKAGREVTTDATLRPRILAIALDGDPSRLYAWDLDAPKVAQRIEDLVEACVDGKIVCGHNLAFDLSWLSWMHEGAVPRGILDSALLVRTHRPGIAQIGLNIRAEKASRPAVKETALELVKQRKTGGSLAGLAAYFEVEGAEDIDKAYQGPANWALNPLSKGHHAYATGDVIVPLELCRRIIGADRADPVEIYNQAMQSQHYRVTQSAVLRLVQMHHVGMPFDPDRAGAYQSELYSSIKRAAGAMIEEAPEAFGQHRETLQAMTASLNATLKEALAGYAESRGVSLRDNEGAPVVDRKVAALAGARDLPAWRHWEALQDGKKRYAMVSEYLDIANTTNDKSSAPKTTLHGLIGVNCATMRTSSQKPNMQNIPNGPMRELFAPGPGYKIIAADYSQIELRIAAALAARSVSEARRMDGKQKRWIEDTIRNADGLGPVPARPKMEPQAYTTTEDRIEAYVQTYRHELHNAWVDIKRRGMPLVEVFRKGLDPHLVTALAICIRKGSWDIPEGESSIVGFMEGCSTDDVAALKERFGAERKAAKAVNFGLLYGMQPWKLWRTGVTDYGLNWSEAEAEDAHAAWLDQYPEVRFWQLWTKLAKKQGRQKMVVRGAGGALESEEKTVWQTRTLTGRTCIAESLNKALNYQDQGSGADMILRAIIECPGNSARGWLCDVVHDELVAVAPEETAEEYAQEIVQAMKRAGESALGPYGIPVEVEYGIGDGWSH